MPNQPNQPDKMKPEDKARMADKAHDAKANADKGSKNSDKSCGC